MAAVAAATFGSAAALAAGGASDARAAAARCLPVEGKRACLRAGQRCVPRNRPDYLQAGFDCRRRGRRLLLTRATPAALRQGRPIDLGASGRPTYSQALAAFDQLVAPLPGVRPAPGTVGASRSGSAAIAWLEGFRARLTRAQRAVLERVTSRRGTPVAATAPADEFIQIVQEARSRLGAKGLSLAHPIELRFDPRQVGQEQAYTSVQWLSGEGQSCVISFRPRAVAGDVTERRIDVTHELMHCAIGELEPSLDDHARMPAWVGEGLPEWAAFRIAAEWGGPFARRDNWPLWLRVAPQVDLFRRAYDALGFWSLVEHEGLNLWPLIPTVVDAAPSGSGAVYRTVTGAVPGDYSEEWGSTLATQAAFGGRWNLDGPGMPALALERPTIESDGPPWGRTFGPRGGYAAQLTLLADVIHVQRNATTVGFLRDSSGTEQPVPDDERYCTDPAGCRCPDGTELPFPPISAGEAVIGVSDQVESGAVAVTGEPLSKHCPGNGSGRGIVLFQKSVGEGVPIAAGFRSGPCRVLRGGRFVAQARSGDYLLVVVISPFGGYRPYDLAYASATPFFAVYGPGGPFTNVYFPAEGTPPAAGGGIAFANRGKRMSLGFINAFNHDATDSVTLAGAMTCQRRARLVRIPNLPR